MRVLFRIPLVVLLLPLLHAQEAPPPTYRLNLRFYTWPVTGIMHGNMEIPSLPPAFLQMNGRPQRVILTRGGLTPPIRYSATEPPVLRSFEAESEDAAPTPRTLAAPVIPTDWKDVTVILFPESTGPNGVMESLVLHTSALEIPEGDSAVQNTTRQPVIVELNGQQTPIPPGTIRKISPTTESERVRMRIYGKDERQTVRMLYTASHWRHEQRGNLYLIYSSRGRLRVLQMSSADHAAPELSGSPTAE